MTNERFVSAGTLSLQEKFLKAEHRSSRESSYGLQHPSNQAMAARENGTVQRLPESIWLLSHKVVSFTQGYIQHSNWTTGVLNWMFVTEPWWDLTYQDHARYAGLFDKQEWFTAMETLNESHRKMAHDLTKRKFTTEGHAVLYFLRDSTSFAEQMYRRL